MLHLLTGFLAASKPETLGLLCADQDHLVAGLVKEKPP